MGMPYRRISKTRKRKRRTHQKIDEPSTVTCSNCGSKIKSHHVCKTCGHYKGKEIIKVDD